MRIGLGLQSIRDERANTCVRVFVEEERHLSKIPANTHTRACAREIDTKRKKGKQIQYKIELLNVCFTNNNQQREQIKHSHTHSGRIQDEENGKNKNLQKQTKAHIAM